MYGLKGPIYMHRKYNCSIELTLVNVHNQTFTKNCKHISKRVLLKMDTGKVNTLTSKRIKLHSESIYSKLP
jgi:lactam utilization protein B